MSQNIQKIPLPTELSSLRATEQQETAIREDSGASLFVNQCPVCDNRLNWRTDRNCTQCGFENPATA